MENNLPFVRKLAHSIWSKNPDWSRALGIEEEDLCQEGCLALDGCVDRFEASYGNKFLSYAAPAIRNAMLDAVAAAQGRFEGRYAGELVRLDSLRQEDQRTAFLLCCRPLPAGPGTDLSAERDHTGSTRRPAKIRCQTCVPGCFSGLVLPTIRSTPWRKRHGIFTCRSPAEKLRTRRRCRRCGGTI